MSKILSVLYSFDSVRAIKDYVRPLKHAVFGKSDIYYVVDIINRARPESDPVTTVLDVGAATGDKTRTFLRAFPQAKIYCCEPQAAARDHFRKRTAPWRERVVLFDCGLYNENCLAELAICSYRDASSLLPMQPFMCKEGKHEIGRESIRLRTLTDLVNEIGLKRIDLLKIDVEGLEKEVLEGAKAVLDRIENIFVEISPLRKGCHSSAHIDVFDMLHEKGLSFLGVWGDYWFSKDPAILAWYFDAGRLVAGAFRARMNAGTIGFVLE
jgi:FkbM family methyltransferase